MKKLLTCVALAALALPGAAAADLCTIEATPAATLLLPYFEVDLEHTDGVNTCISLNNAEPFGILAHVIVWTDMSVEALDFNVFLTGYDVQTISLGLILRDGVLPVTSWDDSPLGPFSRDEAAAQYEACEAVLPYTNPALDEDFLAHLQSILTGGPSSFYGGRCGGYDHGDAIARGYVTVDNVLDCTVLTPCDNGYFAVDLDDPPAGQVGYYLNALWGDWYIIDYANNFAQGDALVHVQSGNFSEWPMVSVGGGEEPPALPTPAENLAAALAARAAVGRPEASVYAGPGGATFWGRCVTVFDEDRFSTDYREPLAATFAAHFFQNQLFAGGTDFLVWRDSLFNVYFGDEDGFSCAAGPAWFPLNERQAVFFDESENPEAVCTISPCPEEDIVFPIEAQRVTVEDLDLTPESGWAYLNLNQLWNVEGSPYVFAGQAWVTAVHSAEGRYSAGLPAIQLDSMCDLASLLLGPSGPGFPAEETVYSPFYWGSFTLEARPEARAPFAGGAVRNPLKP